MRAPSLRRRLLMGILLPVVAFIAFNTFSLYRQALASLNTAYDRTLLASAKTISEQLDVSGYDDAAQLRAIVPYAALEAFEADNQSHMFYRVSTLQGEMVSGFAELAAWRGRIPDRPPYAALVDFYDDQFRGENVRVAVLLQPVASANGRGMAVIQVAETLEVRETLALQILWNTLARQALLIGVIALTVVIVVQRATRPVRQLSQQLQARPDGDLSPIAANSAPRELQPLIDSTNQVMQRLQVRDVPVLSIDEVITSYYLRMRVEDKPGVLADITRILADSSISIEALIQKEAAAGESDTDIIMLTHRTVERNANAAIAKIEVLESVQGKVTKLRVESLS